MQLVDYLLNPIALIAGFFAGVIVSYYTVYRLNERYEYSPDRPYAFSRYKALWSVVSFLSTFITLLFIVSAF